VSDSGGYNPTFVKPSEVRYAGQHDGYRRSAHTLYSCHHTSCLSSKYRKPVLRGDVATDSETWSEKSAGRMNSRFERARASGHVHLLLSVPPHLAPSRVMQAIKG